MLPSTASNDAAHPDGSAARTCEITSGAPSVYPTGTTIYDPEKTWSGYTVFITPESEGVIVIEGVCALHVLFRDAYDLRIWVEAPRELRLARGVARDGEQARKTWEEKWLPSEDRYVERDDPISAADLIVDGSQAG